MKGIRTSTDECDASFGSEPVKKHCIVSNTLAEPGVLKEGRGKRNRKYTCNPREEDLVEDFAKESMSIECLEPHDGDVDNSTTEVLTTDCCKVEYQRKETILRAPCELEN